MTRQTATSRSGLARLIKLADNPPFDDDEDEDKDKDDGYEDDDVENDDSKMDEGKEVHGPRTKLMASVDRLTKGMEAVASNQAFLAQGLLSVLRKEDEGGGGNEVPLTQESQDTKEADIGSDAEMSKAVIKKAAKILAASLAKGLTPDAIVALLNKDDAASSFGEQDNDTPGNRPFDSTDQEENYTVIQGGPGAGTGPVSKSAPIMDAVRATAAQVANEAVRKAQGNPTIMRATSGAPGGASTAAAAMGSETQKSETDSISWASPEATKMSFEQLGALRRAAGYNPLAGFSG